MVYKRDHVPPDVRARIPEPKTTIDDRSHECRETFDVAVLRDTIARLLPEINYNIPPDVLAALREAAAREESELGRQTLEQLVRNYEVAAEEHTPVCQDSGLTVVMLETGQDVHWVGGSLHEAIYDGRARGHEGRLSALVGDRRSDTHV